MRLDLLPPPDWLETTLPAGYSCLVSGDGTALTSAMAAALAGLGWPVAVLQLATELAPLRSQLPAGLPVIAVYDASEPRLWQVCATLTAVLGPIGIWIHLHPGASTLAARAGRDGDLQQSLAQVVFHLAKHLGPSITAAADVSFGAFLAVAQLDGRLGMRSLAASGAFGADLFGLVGRLSQEWSDAFCRVVDLSSDLAPAAAARALLAELHDANRLVTEVGIGPKGRVTLVADQDPAAQALPDVPDGRHAVSGVLIPSGSLPGTLRTFRLWRRLTLEENPLLHDHTSGECIMLPFVCMVGWLANACEGLYPGFSPFSIDDLHMLKGIVFDDSLADAYVLDLKELSKDEQRGEVVCSGLIWSETAGGQMQYHYRARVTLRRRISEVPTYSAIDLSENEHAVDAAELYRKGTLFPRPFLQSVQRVLNISLSRVTLECRLPLAATALQGQFPRQTFDPYQVDAQFQSALIWARIFHNAGGLPLRAHRCELFRSLQPGASFYVSMNVRTSNQSLLVADIVAHDREGRAYIQLSHAEIALGAAQRNLFCNG